VTRIVLLPLDDRPVNYDQPWWLARAAGFELRRPPREWLGSPLRSADRSRLADWLVDEGRAADGIVVAVDTLGYGGLIPSRQGSEPLAEVVAALEPLRALRAARPDAPILGASVLMRVNRSDSAEEEKPYWAAHGRNLFRLSYLDDKAAMGDATSEERAELAALSAAVPAEITTDYQFGRARNHAVNQLMLDWAADGVLDYVVIAQDDTAPYGWNIAEARGLSQAIVRKGLTGRASVYPGADEVGSLLVAAIACRSTGRQPRVWPFYSGAAGADAVTAYEDRPFGELVKAHLGPLGGSIADAQDEADLILAVNAGVEEQGEAWLQLALREPDRVTAVSSVGVDPAVIQATRRQMSTVDRDIAEFTRAIGTEVGAGRDVAVVDVAFVNGADLAFAERLLADVPVGRLASYAAWNTAGNSLGSALAQGVVRSLARHTEQARDALAAHLELLAVHLLDDYIYQGVVRSEVLLEDFPALGLGPSFERLPDALVPEVESRLARRLAPHVDALARKLSGTEVSNGPATCRVKSLAVAPPTLPWKRVFEIAINPTIELA
jgi:hypothetical protein